MNAYSLIEFGYPFLGRTTIIRNLGREEKSNQFFFYNQALFRPHTSQFKDVLGLYYSKTKRWSFSQEYRYTFNLLSQEIHILYFDYWRKLKVEDLSFLCFSSNLYDQIILSPMRPLHPLGSLNSIRDSISLYCESIVEKYQHSWFIHALDAPIKRPLSEFIPNGTQRRLFNSVQRFFGLNETDNNPYWYPILSFDNQIILSPMRPLHSLDLLNSIRDSISLYCESIVEKYQHSWFIHALDAPIKRPLSEFIPNGTQRRLFNSAQRFFGLNETDSDFPNLGFTHHFISTLMRPLHSLDLLNSIRDSISLYCESIVEKYQHSWFIHALDAPIKRPLSEFISNKLQSFSFNVASAIRTNELVKTNYCSLFQFPKILNC